MQFDYDAVIIGGAFSGAATAMMVKRNASDARVLIVEKSAEFDRKVGESTTEISSCYMTRLLGLTNYLGHEHLAKQGLRLWFSNRADQQFDDCVEVGARYQTRLPTFQVDRAKLDQHMLDVARGAGCELLRPAKVSSFELNGASGQTITVGERKITCRWVIDASGRAAMLARKLGHFRQNTEHPINAVWARFSGVKDWDDYSWRERFPDFANACRTSRGWATNHLMGHGWWCWIIPLRGGDVSAGLVYDSRIFSLPEGASLGERLHSHILTHPVGREIFADAKAIEGDIHAFSQLPYYSEKVADDGWALVGDAAGFIDPLYSPGLDFCSYTSYNVADFVARSIAGEQVADRVRRYREQYPLMYRRWFETLYKDKYYYMGDAELMSAALLLDVSSYIAGPVREVYGCGEKGFLQMPFHGVPGRIAAALLRSYNGRLASLARRRIAAGVYGKNNAGWRDMYPGFVPDVSLARTFAWGLRKWLRAEIRNAFLPRLAPAVESASVAEPAAAPAPH